MRTVLEIEDHRGDPGQGMLTNSAIDFLETKDGRAVFQVAAFGNDDIAGLVSHTIGEAFVALSPTGDPFRDTPRDEGTSATEASLAACFLGLGALVANSSMYRRYQSRLVGREVRSEQRVEHAGGLSIADATLVLAVQLTVRDDVPDAVATLHGPQREWIERWIEVLDPHEDELRSMLGLDDADAALPARADKPRVPAATIVEPTLAKRNEGLVSFRVPKRRHRLWLGLLAGFVAAAAARLVVGENLTLLLVLPIGGLAGFLVRRPGFECFACKQVMATELPTCRSCRITLEDTLATRQERKARLARWDAEREAIDLEHAAEAEAAYHPDV